MKYAPLNGPRQSPIAIILAFVLGLLNAILPPSSHASELVTIGFDQNYYPFSYVDQDGTPRGIYTEILQQAFARMEGYQVVVQGYPWKRLMRLVENGNIFAAYPPYYWPQKRPWMAPYSEPILTERVTLYCNKQRIDVSSLPQPLRWPESFYGYIIGNDTGFETPGPEFFTAVEKGQIFVHEDSTLRNVKLLLLGRTDCYVNGELSILHTIKQFIDLGEMQHASTQLYKALTIRENDGYLGYAKHSQAYPFKNDFVERLDIILRDMKLNGDIERVLNRYRSTLQAHSPTPQQ